eukprot:CAMPEP_0202970152 /NCGR_PEP_ID=MMETSP1396-20130829/16139_1 /ASSEMBLY_ACC=CAM_ASM_000872 /TAXON_ID= /ORGANISM="Pseudokeronopsis sp., Strain Brazil" /LENGTH=48 /DNA_ID= /DNA_START= /DNA_END= /DNA_ORIENTATION=
MPQMNGDEMMEQVSEMIQANLNNMGCFRTTKFILCTAQKSPSRETLRR